MEVIVRDGFTKASDKPSGMIMNSHFFIDGNEVTEVIKDTPRERGKLR